MEDKDQCVNLNHVLSIVLFAHSRLVKFVRFWVFEILAKIAELSFVCLSKMCCESVSVYQVFLCADDNNDNAIISLNKMKRRTTMPYVIKEYRNPYTHTQKKNNQMKKRREEEEEE